jgi:uncharacterized membrane protein YbaN (DUF454 family)
MRRETFSAPQSISSREKNLVLMLIAILAALILWNSLWLLWRLALFAIIVFVIYVILKRYI